jgi:predicted ATPase
MKSLVTTDISGELTYHRMLDTTRTYALEKLSESSEVERVRRLQAEYFRDLFERAETEWETRPATEWLGDYAPQIDNLRAALDWAFSGWRCIDRHCAHHRSGTVMDAPIING